MQWKTNLQIWFTDLENSLSSNLSFSFCCCDNNDKASTRETHGRKYSHRPTDSGNNSSRHWNHSRFSNPFAWHPKHTWSLGKNVCTQLIFFFWCSSKSKPGNDTTEQGGSFHLFSASLIKIIPNWHAHRLLC